MANTSDDNFGCITSFFLATLIGIILTVGAVIGWKVAGIVVAVILVVGFVVPTVITLLTWVQKFYVRHGTDRGRK